MGVVFTTVALKGTKMILVSACLIGMSCRYDGSDNKNEKVLKYLEGKTWMPVCPEQMGGLKTPRDPAEIIKDRVVTKSGQDVTAEFVRGADEVARLARMVGANKAILKSRSPSCGSGHIYDGSFSKRLIAGDGLTTRALMKMNLLVQSEEDL